MLSLTASCTTLRPFAVIRAFSVIGPFFSFINRFGFLPKFAKKGVSYVVLETLLFNTTYAIGSFST